MFSHALRAIILLGVIGWYSIGVWNMIDSYFKDKFDTYLREEYAKNPRMKKDLNTHRFKNKIDQVIEINPSLIKDNNKKKIDDYNKHENGYKYNPIGYPFEDCREPARDDAFAESKYTENNEKLSKSVPGSVDIVDLPVKSQTDLGHHDTVIKNEYCPLDLDYYTENCKESK